ncbi:hypothetical protein OKW30_008268 [Paraburkholderia sp. Clong3]|uniref:ATP-binding protein n=1 Tax=Paraburkholderia sp. Clong3 TaxID=2991061 RepID=UPI003D21938D
MNSLDKDGLVQTRLLPQLRRAMALRGWTQPYDLVQKILHPELVLYLIDRLFEDCEIGRGDQDGKWRMLDTPRRNILSEWGLQDVQIAARKIAVETRDGVALAIGQALGAVPFRLDDASVREIKDFIAAQQWTSATTALAYDGIANHLVKRLDQATRQDDVERMTHYGFFDRAGPMRRLRAFLGRRADYPSSTLNVCCVSGRGGVGKSTLIAQLMAQVDRERSRTMFVLLDFDRADLDVQNPGALDRELVTQIGRSIPELASQCAEMARAMRRNLADQIADKLRSNRSFDDSDSGYAYSSSHIREGSRGFDRSSLIDILFQARKSVTHFVIVADTFERVESAGSDAVASMLEWMQSVQTSNEHTSVSIIIAARSTLEDVQMPILKRENINVGDLTRNGAQKLLQNRGCDKELARALVEALPSRTPLVVHLAAEATLNQPEERQAELIASLEKGNIPPELVAGYLYERILKHVDNPLARRYALPSLTLPEIDIELIRDVLIPEIEPEIDSRQSRAEKIFDLLSRVNWLVMTVYGSRLRLRPDLREILIKLSRSDVESMALATRIRARALRYHTTRTGMWHEAMALYHRMMDARNPAEAAELSEQVARYSSVLRPYVDELPAMLRALVSNRAGKEIDIHEAMEQLTPSSWSALLEGVNGKAGRGQYIVDNSDPLTALKLYLDRPTREIGRPPTFALQAACDSGWWDELRLSTGAICQEISDEFRDGPRRWRPMLMRMHWLTRLRMFGTEGPLPPDMIELIETWLPRCKPYGSTLKIVDTMVMVEAFEGRRFLAEDFLKAEVRSEQMARIAAIHDWQFLEPNLSSIPIAGLVSCRRDLEGTPSVILDHLQTEAWEDDAHDLDGQPWAAFQAWFRRLQKVPPLPPEDGQLLLHGNSDPLHCVGLWPEFYRPLRQALCEAFSSSESLRELASAIQHLFPIRPRELMVENFDRVFSSDPFTWFFVLCQHADRAKVLYQMADIAARLSNDRRVYRVKNALARWQEAIRRVAK